MPLAISTKYPKNYVFSNTLKQDETETVFADRDKTNLDILKS